MFVQVFRRVEALVTVLETVYVFNLSAIVLCCDKHVNHRIRRTSILPFATSRLDSTPSITSLIFLTPSSSRFKAASRAASASYFDSPVRGCGPSCVFVVVVLDAEAFCCRLEALVGEAKSSEVSSSESLNERFFRLGVAIFVIVGCAGGLDVIASGLEGRDVGRRVKSRWLLFMWWGCIPLHEVRGTWREYTEKTVNGTLVGISVTSNCQDTMTHSISKYPKPFFPLPNFL